MHSKIKCWIGALNNHTWAQVWMKWGFLDMQLWYTQVDVVNHICKIYENNCCTEARGKYSELEGWVFRKWTVDLEEDYHEDLKVFVKGKGLTQFLVLLRKSDLWLKPHMSRVDTREMQAPRRDVNFGRCEEVFNSGVKFHIILFCFKKRGKNC